MINQLSLKIVKPKEYRIVENHLKLKVYENFFNENECNEYIQRLSDLIKWKREEITVWGKKRVSKRRIAWYGDNGKSYSYAGLKVYPEQWIKVLLEIRHRVEKKCAADFNSVLLNEYPNGNVGMGWHSDDEKELGKNPLIASVSFGAQRDFFLRTKESTSAEKVKITLTSGSVVVMLGETQHYWHHSIPLRRKIKSKRINLTFRKII